VQPLLSEFPIQDFEIEVIFKLCLDELLLGNYQVKMEHSILEQTQRLEETYLNLEMEMEKNLIL
jgi:hypothetical protein